MKILDVLLQFSLFKPYPTLKWNANVRPFIVDNFEEHEIFIN